MRARNLLYIFLCRPGNSQLLSPSLSPLERTARNARERTRRSIESDSPFSAKKLLLFSSPGIPGDGRCLFRSVVHGACLRSGKPSPSESRQQELADELRSKVAEEFIKRRADTEWLLEGDFDTYVTQMRQPHVWGGEPELLMCSHVLQMPITVYMFTRNSDVLKVIAEYGQEYGKQDPIRVLYHAYGHYDTLQIPSSETPLKPFKRR